MASCVVCLVCRTVMAYFATRQAISKWMILLLLVNICRESQGTSDPSLKEFENIVEQILTCRKVPAASITVVKEGRVLMARTFGNSDPEKGIKTKVDTKFCIGSLTKAFTSTILSKLVNDRENVTFDTPIRNILGSSFRLSDDIRTSFVTLRDLLSHRVGVPQYFKALLVGFPADVNREELVRRLQFMPAKQPIRTKFMYSNYMYTLAGHIAEQMTGKTWEYLVENMILKPLKMMDSGFIDQVKNFTNFALPCAIKNGNIRNLEPELLQSVHPCGPAGSLYSTADDMAKWLLLLLKYGTDIDGNRIFTKETMQQTWEAGMPAPFPDLDITKPTYPVSDVEVSYDMAWVTSNYRGYRKIWHSGGIITHSSRLWIFPDKDIAIYSAVNGPQTTHKALALRSIMSYVSDVLLEEEPWLNTSTVCTFPAPWKKEFHSKHPPNRQGGDDSRVKSRPARDYVGKYYHPGFGEIRVDVKDTDSLTLKFGVFGFINLFPKSETKFEGRYYGPLWFVSDSDDQFQPETIEFLKSETGAIDRLIFPVDAKYNRTIFKKGNSFPRHVETLSSKWTFGCVNASTNVKRDRFSLIIFLLTYLCILETRHE